MYTTAKHATGQLEFRRAMRAMSGFWEYLDASNVHGVRYVNETGRWL
jgi:hypothetical protein